MKRVRVLAFLITVCMATTCLLGGTIARYRTSASIDDAATAARWGVTLTAEGSLFGKYYLNGSNGPTSNTDDGVISVKVADNHLDAGNLVNLVAPGTKGDTMYVTLKGAPEVDVRVTVSIKTSDVYLKAGSYAVILPAAGITDANYESKADAGLYLKNGDAYEKIVKTGTPATYPDFDGGKTYYVIQDAVVLNKTADKVITVSGTDYYYPIMYTTNFGSTDNYSQLSALKNDLVNGFTDNGDGTYCKEYVANDNLSAWLGNEGIFSLTWAWDYDNDPGDGKTMLDGADTILGQLAAGATVVKTVDSGATYSAVENSDYCLNAGFDIEVKVEQID